MPRCTWPNVFEVFMHKAFRFENKVVYLISPQNWGVMKVSKHHYALELAERGNRVFFIEPPSLTASGVQVRASQEHPNLNIVTYKPVFRGKRFLPSFVFKLLIRAQIFLLIQKTGSKPDVVWSFSGFLFENLNWFGAEKSIFFMADLFAEKKLPGELYRADLVLGVSDTICQLLQKSNREIHFINHGLNRFFEEQAKQNLLNIQPNRLIPSGRIQVGYVGNLRMEALDRETMKDVVSQFIEIDFIFWGSYELRDANLGGTQDAATEQFISFLKKQPNVELRGPTETNRLVKEVQNMNLFWLCWRLGAMELWDGSNSHKIIEYLSTGRPIVSHNVSTYNNTDLFYMLPGPSNENYLILLGTALNTAKKGEPLELIKSRLEFSIMNSYSKHLQKIEELISNA